MNDGKYRRSCRRNLVRLFKTGRFLLVLGLFMIFMLYGFSAAALNTKDKKAKYSEYKIKAAYLYNFAKFVEWPAEELADPSLPLSVCIYGKDPFGAALDSIKDKTVKGRKLVISRSSEINKLEGCHILFISPSEKNNLSVILKKLRDMHILTVSDMEGFASNGGMINLNKVENKIRLEINLDAAEISGLKMSSKLLKLAKIIKGKN